MEQIVDFLFGSVMRFSYSLTNNYLFAIFLFTLVMEIVLSPIAIKQQKNQIKQARLAPKVAAIRKKYAGRTDQATQQRMQQETMDLYTQEKANPMGGCLPMLIQFPVILAIYQVVVNPLRYLCRVPSDAITGLSSYLREGNLFAQFAEKFSFSLSNYPQFNIINILKNASAAEITELAPEFFSFSDRLAELTSENLPNFHVSTIDLSNTPEISFSPFNWLMFIPVVTFIVMVLSTKIMQKFSYRDPMAEQQQNSLSMKIMMYSMPLLSVFIEFSLPALIGIYWIFRNVLQLVEKLIIAKIMPLPKISQEEYDAAEREANMSNKQKKRAAAADRGDRPFVRSLHHIDDEEYLARHAEELKEIEEERIARENYRPKLGAGKSTKAKNAPAPIKNDEKTSYEEKSSKKSSDNRDETGSNETKE